MSDTNADPNSPQMAGCQQEPCSPSSDTPETDAALVDGMPEPEEWSQHYLDLAIHARRMERERDAARIPICIGRPIIEILAKKGVWASMNGNAVVAADCLFGKNPYQENGKGDPTLTAPIDSAPPKTPTRSALGRSAGSAISCANCFYFERKYVKEKCGGWVGVTQGKCHLSPLKPVVTFSRSTCKSAKPNSKLADT